MKINKKIRGFFALVPVMALATADLNGVPNVSAIASKRIIGDEKVITIDTFHKKTLDNILKNPYISIAFWKDSVGYQIKGLAKYHTQGKVFDENKAWILKSKPQKIVKGVLEITVTGVFCLTPNYKEAGQVCT